MTIKINTHYGQAISSEMLNEKISSVVGANSKLKGFSLKKIDDEIIVGPGKCIISGAIIENTDNKIIPISSLGNIIDAFIVISYDHYNKSIEYKVANNDTALENELFIGKINIASSEVIDIDNLKTIGQLSSSYKSLRDSLLTNQEISYSGKEIITTDSIEGNIHDFKISGDTVLNLAPIKDITPIYGEFKSSGENIKIPNSKNGHINGISIHGNTIKNLCVDTFDKRYCISNEATYFPTCHAPQKNVLYTAIFNIKSSNINRAIRFMRFNFSGRYQNVGEVTIPSVGIHKMLFTPSFSSQELTYQWLFWNINYEQGDELITDVMILEGDWTGREIPDYFEGIKSVGQTGDLSEVQDITPITLDTFNSVTSISTDSLVPANIDINSTSFKKEVFLEPSTEYTLKLIKHIDGNLKIKICGLEATLNNENSVAIITTPATLKNKEYLEFSGWGDIEKVMLTKGPTEAIYTDGFGSVAQDEPLIIISSDALDNITQNILLELDEPLRRVEDVSDSIECIKDKWCITRRTMEVSLKDLDIRIWSQFETEKYISICFPSESILGTYKNAKFTHIAQCSLFNVGDVISIIEKECSMTNTDSNPPYLAIRVRKDRLISSDANGIRDFVTRNNVKFILALKTPEITPLNKALSIEAFNKFTKIYASTNVKPVIDAKIPTTLGSIIKADVERISRIEDTIDRLLLPTLVDVDHNKTLMGINYSTAKSKGE